MSAATDGVASAIQSVTEVRASLRRVRHQRQVRSTLEKAALAKLSNNWYGNYSRPIRRIASIRLAGPDDLFSKLLDASDHNPSRAICVGRLDLLRDELISIRSQILAAEAVASASTKATPIPAFASVITNREMQNILVRRWQEAERCLNAGAALAAMVMMGGLLEGLLMARVERLADKKPVFTAKAAPKDKSGNPLPQRDWTLNNYIAIAHELKWIGETGKSVSVVLRDYRNYVHPYKELSEGVTLTVDDAAMLWAVVVTLTDQILRSAIS